MMTERANAKINLFLDVLSKREDGYHNTVSVMQSISLCDFVSVTFRPGQSTRILLEASGNAVMPTDCRNLAWRAAERFLSTVGKRGEVQIRIEKHIPMAAGLAGGSADAAAVLRVLNRLCGTPLDRNELCSLGAKLGADVPFCIVGGTATATGIGEILKPEQSMPCVSMVIACQGEGISTPTAYAALDTRYDGFKHPPKRSQSPERLVRLLSENRITEAYGQFFNVFEEVVSETQPYVSRIRQAMLDNGALQSMMSGSGPSVFGLFESAEDAERACTSLLGAGADAFVCHPCGENRI